MERRIYYENWPDVERLCIPVFGYQCTSVPKRINMDLGCFDAKDTMVLEKENNNCRLRLEVQVLQTQNTWTRRWTHVTRFSS